MSLLEESSQWQRMPESLLDLEDGHYFMYGKIKNEYKRGWPIDLIDYETIHVIKLGRKFKQFSISLSVGVIPSHGNISITPEYYMKAKEWPKPPYYIKAEEWPKPPAKEGQDEKTG